MKTEKSAMSLAIVFVVVAIAASAVAAGLYAPRSIEKLLPNGDALEISVYDKETETETFLPSDKISDFLAEMNGGKYVKLYNFRKAKVKECSSIEYRIRYSGKTVIFDRTMLKVLDEGG
ncbi:MAG TPA: hypothetical protein DEQ88_00280, partial [Clostridiales bacterium]|nr:hypothetical protein [Clostridiales bacterium]